MLEGSGLPRWASQTVRGEIFWKEDVKLEMSLKIVMFEFCEGDTKALKFSMRHQKLVKSDSLW